MTDRRVLEELGPERGSKRVEMLNRKRALPEGFEICSLCERTLPLSEFYPGKKAKGVSSHCKACAANRTKKDRARSPERRLKLSLSTARISARRKGIPCTLKIEDLLEMWEGQRGRCFYSGVSMSYAGDGLPESVSLDRIDSSNGYVPANVVLCCSYVNTMKNSQSVEEFVRWCRLIVHYEKEDTR